MSQKCHNCGFKIKDSVKSFGGKFCPRCGERIKSVLEEEKREAKKSLVIIDKALEKLKEMGARRALVLPVGGAFHSPLMASAQTELSEAINNTEFKSPICPIYQNVTASPVSDLSDIKTNLEKQLTAPVRWTQTMQQMIADGMTSYNEVGGKVLTGLLKKVDRKMETTQY